MSGKERRLVQLDAYTLVVIHIHRLAGKVFERGEEDLSHELRVIADKLNDRMSEIHRGEPGAD